MTRRTWATDEQHTWLKALIPAFREALQKKTLSKEFFPLTIKEFRDKWPVPELTEKERTAQTSVEKATKLKREKYDKVLSLSYLGDSMN
jgi:hypothetical protein